jgi:hypothetical protein
MTAIAVFAALCLVIFAIVALIGRHDARDRRLSFETTLSIDQREQLRAFTLGGGTWRQFEKVCERELEPAERHRRAKIAQDYNRSFAAHI